MKTLATNTPKGAFDLESQSLSEYPIDAIELTDVDLEQVAGGCWGGCGWGGGWGGGFGFAPFWGSGFGFAPFWGGGFGFAPFWGSGFGMGFGF
jgi:hypothetical protein